MLYIYFYCLIFLFIQPQSNLGWNLLLPTTFVKFALDTVNFMNDRLQGEQNKDNSQKSTSPDYVIPSSVSPQFHLIGYIEHDPKAAAIKNYHQSQIASTGKAMSWFHFLWTLIYLFCCASRWPTNINQFIHSHKSFSYCVMFF